MGHSGASCDLDPNLRTFRGQQSAEVEDDENRIQKNFENTQKKQKLNKLEDFNNFVMH